MCRYLSQLLAVMLNICLGDCVRSVLERLPVDIPRRLKFVPGSGAAGSASVYFCIHRPVSLYHACRGYLRYILRTR
ncbi:hypothetical protein F4811DRAFT_501349 [Daldinia bambusicola]|nr:hypothetical protein F4811DRAFT_501349 [Daldinia bambusicola]